MSGDDEFGPEQARDLARSVQRFLEWVQRNGAEPERNEVRRVVLEFLADNEDRAVVSRQWVGFEHVNLQTALNAWSEQDGREVSVQGISLPPHYGGLSLQHLVIGEGMPPLSLSAPSLADLPNGPGTTLACWRLVLGFVTDARGRYILMLTGPSEHEQSLRLEIAGLPVPQAQAVLAEIEALRARLNVYRGQLLEVSANNFGGVNLNFADLPVTHRADVVLPEAVLSRIERHAFGVAGHRDALLAFGQHLKRGLLLFGPPGTGKTHTTRYLVTHMTAYTRLLLSGRSLHTIGWVTDFARELLPAVVVLEDVDLVAEDRSIGHGSNPVLFELLDAMDGAAADADLLFLLTTNRADLLERALAARPGRVDVAAEIGLPDAQARRQLIELYARSVPLRVADEVLAEAVARSEGVTASFLKELVRRAVLEALRDGEPVTSVEGPHLMRALDDLLDSAQAVTRTLLGVGVDPTDVPPDAGPGPAVARGQWAPRRAYSSRLNITYD